MNSENICRFVPGSSEPDDLFLSNFVLETHPVAANQFLGSSVYRMHLVASGRGTFRVGGEEIPLGVGDLFFLTPGSYYQIIPDGPLEYMYISFLGRKGQRMMDSCGLRSGSVCRGHADLIRFWTETLTTAEDDLLAPLGEAVLLYTFAQIRRSLRIQEKANPKAVLTMTVEKMIRDRFTEPELTPEWIGQALSYNKKYLSDLFKKETGSSIRTFIENVRLAHACALMEQGMSSIKDIARLCGYNDAMYFSKVFRRIKGMTPRDFILSHR